MYVLVNNNDDNNRIELTSTDEESAMVEALERLGYTLFDKGEENEYG